MPGHGSRHVVLTTEEKHRNKITDRYEAAMGWGTFLTVFAGIGASAAKISDMGIDYMRTNAHENSIKSLESLRAETGSDTFSYATGKAIKIDGDFVNLINETETTTFTALIEEQKNEITQIDNSGFGAPSIIIGVMAAYLSFQPVFERFAENAQDAITKASTKLYNTFHAPKPKPE